MVEPTNPVFFSGSKSWKPTDILLSAIQEQKVLEIKEKVFPRNTESGVVYSYCKDYITWYPYQEFKGNKLSN